MATETKACIACAEDIKSEAVLCRFCGTDQNDSLYSPEPDPTAPDSGIYPAASAPDPGVSTGFILTTVLIVLAFFGIGAIALIIGLALSSPAGTEPSAQSAETTTNAPSGISEVYERALPSVVTVYCGTGLGTGFSYGVTPGPGYSAVIVTNEHVVSDCTLASGPNVSVTTSDGIDMPGTLWAWDQESDMALIMIRSPLPPLQPAPPGSIGDPVLVMGSPGGLQGSITTGIISQVYEDAYQTDAAMNRGNSGGPLLDSEGRVLGVNTLGLGREGLNIAFRIELLCKRLVTCG